MPAPLRLPRSSRSAASFRAPLRPLHDPPSAACVSASPLQAGGLSPDVHTYTSLIAGCAYGRQAALARELLRQMQQRGIQPTAWTYNALLNVECWTYGVDAGAALLRSLVAQGMQPDRATWNTLLACESRVACAALASGGQKGVGWGGDGGDGGPTGMQPDRAAQHTLRCPAR